jgi:hypothetical protein
MLAHCAGKSDLNPLPKATDPNATTQTIPNTTPSTDPRIPDLSKAVAIHLDDNVNYTGLKDLAHVVYAPVIGDALISMNISGGRTTSFTSSVLIAFEDHYGFWGALQNSFTGTTTRTSNSIDAIHSDSEFTIRIVAGLNGDTLSGSIYYRIRQTGETQCFATAVTCNYTGTPPANYSNYCPYPTPDTSAACRNYMNTGLAAVKRLGTFNSSYSSWTGGT